MKGFKEANLNERLERAAKAKQAMLEKFRAQPGPDDPEVIKRRQEQIAIAEAREARQAAKAELKAREAAEKAEREAAEKVARKQAENRAAIERVIRGEEKSDAQKKAERDARYAARKARQARR